MWARAALGATALAASTVALFPTVHSTTVEDTDNCTDHPAPTTLTSCIQQARDAVNAFKTEHSIPGISIGVALNGKCVWQEGFGYSDLENRVPCTPQTVMRIASISKPITAAALFKLWEEGKVDLDASVKTYVPSYPEKTFEGAPVLITSRQLLSHLSGIRHYDKSLPEKTEKPRERQRSKSGPATVPAQETPRRRSLPTLQERMLKYPEVFNTKTYASVPEALSMFQDDPLLYKPGTKFMYTTHGWTLLSAVIESVAGEPFPKYIKGVFRFLGLNHTYLDENLPIIHNRARYYERGLDGSFQNAPYVDNSYKWAGGGFLSTVGDLCHFGNSMLYCFQLHKAAETVPSPSAGYLKPDTVEQLWSMSPNTKRHANDDEGYGMGWVVRPHRWTCGYGREVQRVVYHSGESVGASSMLLILPADEVDPCKPPPQGVVVAVLTNTDKIRLRDMALYVAQLFTEVPPTS